MSARRKKPDDLYRQIIVRVPPEMHAAVKAQAASEDRTMSQTIRRALKRYLEQENDG